MRNISCCVHKELRKSAFTGSWKSREDTSDDLLRSGVDNSNVRLHAHTYVFLRVIRCFTLSEAVQAFPVELTLEYRYHRWCKQEPWETKRSSLSLTALCERCWVNRSPDERRKTHGLKRKWVTIIILFTLKPSYRQQLVEWIWGRMGSTAADILDCLI